MAMPKTAVDKDDCTIFAHHDVGRAGQLSHIDAETHSAGEQKPPHNPLRFCVRAMDAGHAAMTLFGREGIGHGIIFCRKRQAVRLSLAWNV